MKHPVAKFIGRSSLIGLLAFIGASVTAENSETAAVDPAKVDEAVVQVWGARSRGAKGIFGVHTWVAVKPEGAAEYTVYEVVGWRLRWSESALVIRNRAPDSWFGAPGELYAEKRGAGVEKLIERVEAAAREYPFAKDYTLWPGPNSNTFTAWIARAVPELEVDLPATAIGKDYIGSDLISSAPSGRGFQFSLRGLFGVAASGVDGLELNILSLNFGLSSSGLKLPLVGRIGAPRIEASLPAAQPASLP
ncbi:MAG TPA: DUF3750 domain-containing protein [Burkholderiales bacterium]|nr:DUF3750 domain-containing protein [Burkholderiales bacterium]